MKRFRTRSILPAVVFMIVVMSLLLFFLYDTPAMHTTQQHMRRITGAFGIQLMNAFRDDSNDARNGTKHVIVVSLARSGSSFAGDILGHGREVYYVFEPLKKVMKVMEAKRKKKEEEGDINGANRLLSETRSDSRSILENLVTCNFRGLDLTKLDPVFMARNDLPSKSLVPCIDMANKLKDKRRAKIPTIPNSNNDDGISINSDNPQIAQCLDSAAVPCLASKVRVLKVIRTMVRDLEPMLHDNPDLHMILLVRDPRGSLWSRKKVFKEDVARTDTSTFAHSYCNRLDEDVTVALELVGRFPQRIRLLKYEALADNPLEVSRKMYDYLGIKWTSRVSDQIKAQTSADELDPTSQKPERTRFGDPPKRHITTHNPYSVRRGDSSRAARAWRETVDWSFVKIVQEKCFPVMRRLGYELFRLGKDIRDVNHIHSFHEPDDISDDVWLR